MKMKLMVLMLLTLGAVGKVVKDFTDKYTDPACKRFFLAGEPPEFNPGPVSATRYKHICQEYNNKYYYATLYDTTEKIPVYSAYRYERTSDCNIERPAKTWMIEPQLEDQNKSDNMALQEQMKVKNQAYNSEYTDSRYDKGHLYPFCHTNSNEAAESTFTLTNAAPQRCDFNTFWYSKVENQVRNSLKSCLEDRKTAFVVTGVVPSSRNNKKTLKKDSSVNVPSHFWTAYCCADNNNKCKFGGYIMAREDDEAISYINIVDFHTELTELYNLVSVKVFNKTRVTEVDDGPPTKKRRI